jgi:hypothetical protein
MIKIKQIISKPNLDKPCLGGFTFFFSALQIPVQKQFFSAE